MAVIGRDHLSSEVGHSSGASRVVLTIGLVLIGVGILVFLAGLLTGMFGTTSGAGGDSSVQLFTFGGSSVVVGCVVAAIGMAWARREAGE